MANNNFEQCLSRCALGDLSAFESLYSDAGPHLFGLILRIVKKQEWAEDVLQEVMINIWEKAGQYRDTRGRAITWMLGIARNKSIDWLRQSGNTAPVIEVNEAESMELLQLNQQTMDDTDFLETQKLHECLNALEQEQKTSILLAYFNGLSHAELSHHLQTALGTVKSWVRRGLQRLKACLEI